MGERQKRSVPLLRFPLAIVFGVLSGVAQAGSSVWTSGGPYGGPVNDLAIDPKTPSTLYAGTAAGVFKSTDSGGTWTIANNGLGVPNVFSLVMDPVTPSTLYAGTNGGWVFKSTDSAATWTAAGTGLPTNRDISTIATALAINPLNPSIVYAGENGAGIFKSTDAGATWAAAETELAGWVTAIAVDPKTPSTLYAATEGGGYGLLKSTDSGATWSVANGGLTDSYVHALAIDPSTPSTLYAGTYPAGVFKSTDSGGTWIATHAGLPSTSVLALTIDPSAPTTLYAGTRGSGVYRTTDSGSTWTAMSAGLTNLEATVLAIDPKTPSTVYTGTGGGVFKSADSGATWVGRSTGLASDSVQALAMSPSTPSTLFTGTYGGGVFRSTDAGATWTPANTGLTNPGILALAVDPVNPAWIYAATSHTTATGNAVGIFRSTDAGETWAQTSLDAEVLSLAIDPLTPSTLYAGTYAAGIFKSIDGGKTWIAVNNGLAAREDYGVVLAIVIDPSTPSTVYASWRAVGPQNYGGGISKSTNSGATWADAGTGLPWWGGVGPVAIDPRTPSTLYAGAGDVYRSTDAGGTWAPASSGLTDSAESLAIDPSTPSTVYAGTYSEGIFRSTDAGKTWAAFNTGLPWTPGHMPPVSALVVNPFTKTVSAGFNGGSVWQIAPSAVESYSVTVPVVISAAGRNGSFFTSELTLTNRGNTDVSMTYTYTSALGGSSGTASDTLPAGTQKILPDAIEYLRGLGIPVGDSGNRRGTPRIDFSAPASATVRTTTAAAGGRAGLAYAGLPEWKLLSAPVYLCGLRQNLYDRSNVAVLNAGTSVDGPITLRLTVISGDPAQPQTQVLPDITLPPGGFSQVNGILASNGLLLTNGYVKVEEVAGNAPFYAYGTINDQANSDGSFVEPIPVDEILSPPMLTLPAIVETPLFSSELVLTNLSANSIPRTLHCVYVAPALTGGQAAFDITLLAGEQQILPAVVQVLRDRGVIHDPPGRTFAGALFVTGSGGYTGDLSVAARTSTPGDGGRYGAYYPAVPAGSEATTAAWLYDFQQDAGNRTNLALVNVGSVDDSTDTFRIDLFDGATGQKAGTAENVTVPAKGFLQLNAVLSRYAPSVSNGYALVTRTSGNNPFIAYAVINDGGEPGMGSGDGAFIAADVPP